MIEHQNAEAALQEEEKRKAREAAKEEKLKQEAEAEEAKLAQASADEIIVDETVADSKSTETSKEEKSKKDEKEKLKAKNKKAKDKKEKRGLGKKVKDTTSELKKVSWPTFKQVVKKTGVVLAVVLFFAVALFAFDFLCSLLYNLFTGNPLV
ncbi:MAG: preprotein translocase subunit SecE [Clostridia bacterium]|nr:preprotein translocase subunit SecE [Clostridia bacterium]